MRLVQAFAILAAIQIGPASSADLTGTARVLDGDTIEVNGQRVRLFGIDAPEGGQACSRQGTAYDCGQEATQTLVGLLYGKSVHCVQRDTDRYRRIVATCYLNGRGGSDVNGHMVREGWALAYRHYSWVYVDEEESAHHARRGMWAGVFKAPWEWRAERR